MKEPLRRALPFLTIVMAAVMLLSLKTGWLNPFFFGAEHAQVQGVDFFALPKSFLNLMEGRSAYDTWGGTAYGPYATWYLAHPAFSVFVCSWFALFPPWTAYWLFQLLNFSLLVFAAKKIAELAKPGTDRQMVFLIMLCSFPGFWMMYVGNMHAPLVLALSLIFAALYMFHEGKNPAARPLLLAGLLISLFSKPIVLLMLPVLLLLPESRKTVIVALLIYIPVSFLFLVVPALNPESIGLAEMVRLSGDPEFVKNNMNIFRNNFVLNRYMLDNSIHWLNLVAQSDYRLEHIDVFSLPVFCTGLMKNIPATLFRLPVYVCLLLSCIVPFIADRRLRIQYALLLAMAISLSFFLSYNTVWEYQYSSVLPVSAMVYICRGELFFAPYRKLMLLLALLVSLPSLYFLVPDNALQNETSLLLIRSTRVLPVTALFIIMIAGLSAVGWKNFDRKKLKKILVLPGTVFFR